MVYLVIALILLPPFLVTFLLQTRERRLLERGLRALALAPALGFGLGSLADFFLRYLLDRNLEPLGLVLLWSPALVIAMVRFFLRRPAQVRTARAPIDPELGLLAAFLLGLALISGMTIYRSMTADPRGQWDAVMTWNLLGRALAVTDGDAGEVLRPMRSTHAEYPHMIPGSIALILRHEDSFAAGPGQFVAIMGFLSLIGLALFCGSELRGPKPAFIVTGLMLATPFITLITGDQYSETWMFGLNFAAIALFARGLSGGPGAMSFMLLGGFFLGLLPWTKQEGVPYAFGIILAFTTFCLFNAPRLVHLKRLACALLVATPGFLASLLFRLHWAPEEERLRLTTDQAWGYITDRERWDPVLDALWLNLTTKGQFLGFHHPADFNQPFQKWAALWPAVVLLMLVWFSLRGFLRRDTVFVLLALFAQLSAAVLIFVIIPIDQQFHIDTAFDRALLQLAPGVLLLALCLKRPETAAGEHVQETPQDPD